MEEDILRDHPVAKKQKDWIFFGLNFYHDDAVSVLSTTSSLLTRASYAHLV